MFISNYIVTKQIDDNGYLIYHTLFTSLLILTKEAYQQVFLNHDFSDTSMVGELKKMGFLQDSQQTELDIIKKIREEDSKKKAQTVTIFSTNDCNARCYYCFEEGIVRSRMSFKTATQIVHFIKSFFSEPRLQIHWFGGEPLMAMDIIEYITKGLKNNGFVLSAHITTNGSLITHEIIDFFKTNYESISFQITIDDVGDKYARIKRYTNIDDEKAFELIIENCKKVIRANLFLAIRINFLPQKFEYAKSVYLQLCSIFNGMNLSNLRIYLSPITLSEECSACNETILSAETFVELAKFHYNNHVNDFSALNRKSILMQSFYLKPKPSSCGATRSKQVVITADGNLYKCHRFVRYPGTKYVIGNIWDGINYDSTHYREFMDINIDDECKSCRVLPICQGGCFAIRHIYGRRMVCAKSEKIDEMLEQYYKVLLNS